VIAILASVFDFDRQQSREVGCDDFLPKPIREADLLEKLQLHLGLEWIYEETKSNRQEQETISPQSNNHNSVLIAPPAEEVAVLLDLAKRGDLRGMVKRAAQLEELDRQWIPFVTHLRQLATRRSCHLARSRVYPRASESEDSRKSFPNLCPPAHGRRE